MRGTKQIRLFAVAVLVLLAVGLASQAGAQTAAQKDALARLAQAAHPNAVASQTQDTGSAPTTPLNQPGGLAYDTAGNLYIADTLNNVIREVNLTGIISTVAGSGAEGFGGDGGAATSALLDSPAGVVVDSSGNVYIADTHNNRIRKVSSGTITTIAGTGTVGFSGDGGPATSATMALPTAVTVDSSGNLYIADTNNNRIRKITGTTISTVAGDGTQTYSGDGGPAIAAGLDSPAGVAVDSASNVYISDTHNQRVRMVTASTGLITTIAGNGVAGYSSNTSAATTELDNPIGIAVDSTGTVYIADSDNQLIRAVTPAASGTTGGATISTIAGNGDQGYSPTSTGSATSTTLDSPQAVAVNNTTGTVAVADTSNQTVNAVSSTGSASTVVAPPPASIESLIAGGPSTAVYGTGVLAANFNYGTNTATGAITFYDVSGGGRTAVGTVALAANTASVSMGNLSVGTHSMVASYSGDLNNPPITSSAFVVQVTPAPITATFNTVNLAYGQTIPALTGILNGVLAQDAGSVAPTFATTASSTSVPSSYPVTVSLSGPAAANYTVSLASGSGAVVIGQAASSVTLISSSATTAFNSPVTFTMTVTDASPGSIGMPAGSINCYQNGMLLNSSPMALTADGKALWTGILPAAGTYSITATYSGNADFAASSSSTLTEAVLPSIDFSLGASNVASSAITIAPGAAASYQIVLTPVNPTFLYSVNLTATGLPPGATATFSPATIAAGSGTTTSTLTIQTVVINPLLGHREGFGGAIALGLLLFPFTRRLRRSVRGIRTLMLGIALLVSVAAMTTLTGCADGLNNSSPTSYTINVVATSTGPNGTTQHVTTVGLTVQ